MKILSFFQTPGNPYLGWKRRVGFDAALALVLYIVMMDRITGNPTHEVLGFLIGAAFLIHIALNAAWYKLPHPRSAVGGIRDGAAAVLNIVLTASLALSVATGAAVSQSVLAFATPFEWRMSLDMRTAHVAWSTWFFLLAGIHLGLHSRVFTGMIRALVMQKKGWMLPEKAFAAAGAAAAAAGAAAFLHRGVTDLLMFEAAFITVERDEWVTTMPLEFIAIFLGAASIAACAGLARDLASKTLKSFRIKLLNKDARTRNGMSCARQG